jgi:HYR domain/Fibronectin type III domain
MKPTIPLAAAAALLAALVLVPGGAGNSARSLNGLCGSPPCFTTFTVDGGAPPPGVGLSVSTLGANVQVSVTNGGSNELSPAITPNDTIHMVLNLGTYDPVVFGTTGLVTSYSESTGGTNTITLDLSPQPSSWNAGGCTVVSCGSDISPVTATHDFASIVLGFVSDLSTSGATQATKDAMRGTWFSTNAQSMALPSFANNSVNFTVAAPHFMTDGTTVNTGFFEFFAPDALVQLLGIADPTTVTNQSFTVSNSNGGSATIAVEHDSSPQAGVLIRSGTNPPTLPRFNYSSPKFTVTKKTASLPGAPTGVSATAGNAQATVSFSPPASDGGATITSYRVTASPGGANATGGSSPITVTGLTNGTSYTFTVTATNSAGTGTASSPSNAVTPFVPDTTSPVLSNVPASRTLEATGPAGARATFALPTATDDRDGTRSVSCNHQSGDTFPLGATIVTCSATDTSGNVGSATFTITVQDTLPPRLTIPIRVYTKAAGPVDVSFTVTATDRVSGSLPVTCTPPSGSLFQLGTTLVTCTATDGAGNVGSTTFRVEVAAKRAWH